MIDADNYRKSIEHFNGPMTPAQIEHWNRLVEQANELIKKAGEKK